MQFQLCRRQPGRLALFALAVAAILSGKVGARDATSVDAAQRILAQAKTPQRNGSHLSLLFALRQLRDPALRPMFQQLLANEDWQIQVHAVLGLAELDLDRRIDPSLFAQIAPQTQEAAAATGLDLKLIGREEMRQILATDDLNPMARLILTAEFVLLKEPVEHSELENLSNASEDYVAGLASLLLAQLGKPDAFLAYQSRIAKMPAREREQIVGWMLEVIRQYELVAAQSWIESVLTDEALADVALPAVHTLLKLNPAAGLAAWKKTLHANPGYSQRVRCGLLLLASSPNVPATAYDELRPEPGEELVEKIIAVGRAIAKKSDPVAPLNALVDLGHGKSTAWVMSYLKELPPEQAKPVYLHLIERVESAAGKQDDTVARAIEATTRLAELDLPQVLSRLGTAEDDGVLQQTLLLGLFESSSPEVGKAAAALPRIGSGRADSLALILIAKHAPSLSKDDLDQLGVIASGGGRVSSMLQVQAAWLYLKHKGQIETALK